MRVIGSVDVEARALRMIVRHLHRCNHWGMRLFALRLVTLLAACELEAPAEPQRAPRAPAPVSPSVSVPESERDYLQGTTAQGS